MTQSIGIILAFIALLCWGFGDFLIQKTIRATSTWKALFFISIVGFLGLLPFVISYIALLSARNWLLLILLSVIITFAALFDFAALRQGKIAIIEPVMGLELPLTVGFGIVLAHESLSTIQAILIVITFLGIMFAVTEHHSKLHFHKRIFEKGVILAGIGAIGMAISNYMVGVSSQSISPVVTIWFIHLILSLVCIIYLLYKKEFLSIFKDIKKHPKLIISESVLDNAAWLAFASATVYIPISIATTISESYVALAAMLGVYINHEKLKKHQIIGACIAIVSVIMLSYFSA